jgi:hypothetical protein
MTLDTFAAVGYNYLMNSAYRVAAVAEIVLRKEARIWPLVVLASLVGGFYAFLISTSSFAGFWGTVGGDSLLLSQVAATVAVNLRVQEVAQANNVIREENVRRLAEVE